MAFLNQGPVERRQHFEAHFFRQAAFELFTNGRMNRADWAQLLEAFLGVQKLELYLFKDTRGALI